MEKAGEILKGSKKTKDLVISKRRGNKIQAFVEIRELRERRDHDWGFTTHPFVLCAFPVKPMAGIAEYVRKNGKHTLRVLGSVEYGLPWGMDRLIPIWIITEVKRTGSRVIRFEHIREILDMFGLVNNGRNHKRIQDAFRRVLSARIVWERDDEIATPQVQTGVFRGVSFSFIDELQLVEHHKPADADQAQMTLLPELPDMFNENVVIVAEQLFTQIMKSPIPIDLRVVRALTDSPNALDLFIWLSFRCNQEKGVTKIPLYGETGLQGQFGGSDTMLPKKFKQSLKESLGAIKAVWPDCPAQIINDQLVVRKGSFILPAGS